MNDFITAMTARVPAIKRLLLYNNLADVEDFEDCLRMSGATVDELLETKCLTTVEAISYLLDFQPANCETLTNAIIITLQSVTGDNGHIFTIIPVGNQYVLCDSYYNHRSLTFNILTREEVIQLLIKVQQLRRSQNELIYELWEEITSVPYEIDNATHVMVIIDYYTYNMNTSTERYVSLIDNTITKLTTAINIGQEYDANTIMCTTNLRYAYNYLSDDILIYLSAELDEHEALRYLSSLLI